MRLLRWAVAAFLVGAGGLAPSLGVATTLGYTIVDLGAPPASVAASAYPIGLNNTGQFFGLGIKSDGEPTCVAYNNGAWFAFSVQRSQTACVPYSMNDATTAGVYEIVGYSKQRSVQGTTAFLAKIGPNGVDVRKFPSHSPSELDGINDRGVAVGFSYYAPPQGWFDSYAPFVADSGRFAPLQKRCAKTHVYCMSLVWGNCQAGNALKGNQTLNCPVGAPEPFPYFCPFGGCVLNNNNVVLGADAKRDHYETYTIGQPKSGYLLPLDHVNDYMLGINDAGEIAYGEWTGNCTWNAYRYTVQDLGVVQLPPIVGQSYTSYEPLAQNNFGYVLGTAQTGCGGSPIYWLYDGYVEQTMDLSAMIPPNTYSHIILLGLNDHRQVLAQLEEPSGEVHWGYLQPSS